MQTTYEALEQRWAEIKDLEHGLAVLGWDQEVMMPSGGAALRAHTLATLTGVVHERRTANDLVQLVNRLHRKRKELKPQQRRGVELAHDAIRKAALVPASLAKRIALQESRNVETWRRAREDRDFKPFASDLATMIELKAELAQRVSGGKRPYDALIDEFEAGGTQAQFDPLLTRLKDVTVPLLQRVVASDLETDLSPLVGRFDVEAQRTFARSIVTAMGIDLGRGRMDLSTHPFCGGVGPDDVRMTSRYDPHDMRGGLFGAIHEAGHGLYEQGLSSRRARTPLGGAISMSIHESQSRLWENNVARSRPFWKHWLPKLRRAHPQLKGLKLDTVWRAANHMTPSMIRVEADELTYNLHIVLRYEIERDLFAGSLAVKDLPERWNESMRELLGVVPRHDAEGVLQDIHWAMGLFGYFPTYSLGNLYAAQFMEAAREQLPDLDERLAEGDLGPLRAWLQDKIHKHDRVHDAAACVKRVTGRPLGTDAFERYIGAKIDALHGPA